MVFLCSAQHLCTHNVLILLYVIESEFFYLVPSINIHRLLDIFNCKVCSKYGCAIESLYEHPFKCILYCFILYWTVGFYQS